MNRMLVVGTGFVLACPSSFRLGGLFEGLLGSLGFALFLRNFRICYYWNFGCHLVLGYLTLFIINNLSIFVVQIFFNNLFICFVKFKFLYFLFLKNIRFSSS